MRGFRIVVSLVWAALCPALLTSQGTSSFDPTKAVPGLPESPADTGRMLHGWRDFSRYDWAGRGAMCAAAIPVVNRLVHRVNLKRSPLLGGGFLFRYLLDTVAYPEYAKKTLAPPALLVAKQCGAVILADNGATPLASSEAITRLSLATQLGDEKVIATTLDQYLPSVSSTSEQAKILGWVLLQASEALPLRVSLFETVRDRLDAIGPTNDHAVLFNREMAVGQILSYWIGMGDTVQARVAAQRAMALYPSLPFQYGNTMYQRGVFIHPEDIKATELDLATLQSGGKSPVVIAIVKRQIAEQLAGVNDPAARAQMEVRLSALWRHVIGLYGTTFVPPETKYWYPSTQAPSSGTTKHPGLTPGRVTLVWQIDNTCYNTPGVEMGDQTTRCRPVYAMLRRLADKYGPKGFDLLLVEKTRGYVLGSGLKTPEEEAAAIRSFWQDHMKLPATVVVQETPFDVKPQPDGRRVNHGTPWERRYIPPGFEVNMFGSDEGVSLGNFLVDRDGKIQWIISDYLHQSEPVIDMFIERLLNSVGS